MKIICLRLQIYKIILIMLIICLLAVNGCWDAEELGNLAIVAAVGIDQDDKTGMILITAQIIKPGEVKSASSGGEGGGGEQPRKGGSQQAFLIVQSTGKTVSEAFRNFAFQLNRELYLSDNQIIVLGSAVAKKGVRPLLDYFIREREPREITWILVAKGKASEVLEAQMGLEKIPAIEITRLIENRNTTSQVSGITLAEFANRLMSKTTAAYATSIKLMGEPKKAQLIGTAIFKDDRYVGQLDKTETRGFLWVIGKVVRGIITVNSPKGGQFNFGILKAKSEISPELDFGKLNIRVEVTAQCSLSNETMPEERVS